MANESNTVATGQQDDGPVPVPVPVPKTSSIEEVSRPEVEGLCTLLADLMVENGSKRPTITKAWRTSARLLLDSDGRDVDYSMKIMRWCQESEFWRSNVMSMPKFREKYDQLRLQADIATEGDWAADDRAYAALPRASHVDDGSYY